MGSSNYGPKYSYYPKASKLFLIVKIEYKDAAEQIFRDSKIKTTTEGARHLGVILRELNFKGEYIHNIVQSWRDELEIILKKVKIQPQAAYLVYIYVFKQQFTFFYKEFQTYPNTSS